MADIVQTICDEQTEAMAILHKAYPKWEAWELSENAKVLRTDRYKRGRYLTVDECGKQWPPATFES